MDFLEGERTDYHPFYSLSPERLCTLEEDPVSYTNEDLQPTPEARDAVSFGYGRHDDDDVLSTTASDSEDLAAGSNITPLPPSGQERHGTQSYDDMIEVVTRAVDKLGLVWDSEPASQRPLSKLDDRFLTARAPSQSRRPLPFFHDLHQEVSKSWKQPFS
ncbi:MAG: hypothetical protein ACRDC4_04285, partial [Plesiomonas sp.]